jgi:uncharacterized Zn finger protein (UPF0148 family)
MSRRPLLGVVHPETGEVLSCPQCQTREDVIVQLEKENRLHKAKITKLERADEQISSMDPLWEEAQAIHEWWRLACWHPLARFDLEDFKLIRPHLKRGQYGLIECLQAICGAAFDPYKQEQKNGKLKAYNDWDTIFKTKAKMERFAERVPGEEGSQLWKTWLVQRIESNLSAS